MRRRLVEVIAVIGVLWLSSPVRGERLPIRSYTTAEGLPHNTVNRIVRDSRGFLWFATNGGLSRFDGYGFTNFGVEQGLPHRAVTDLLETRGGELWVATLGGLVRFRPYATGESPMFTAIVPADPDPRARALISLLEGRDGSIWCGTRKGLFRLDTSAGRPELRQVDIGIPPQDAEGMFVNDLLEDQHDVLWIATPRGLYRRRPDGRTARYGVRDGLPGEQVHDLLYDREGRIWVATRDASFFRITADDSPRPPRVHDHHDAPQRSGSNWVDRLLETSDRRFWATTNAGLVEFPASPTGSTPFLSYTQVNGVSQQDVTALAEDAGGNLWIGTATGGAMKLSRGGFVSYGHSDGLATASGVVEDLSGQLHVLAGNVFGRIDGNRFDWFAPAPPFAWGPAGERAIARTRSGEWWLAGTAGLFRYPSLPSLTDIAGATPRRVFPARDGVPASPVDRIFADSRDDVWFSATAPTTLFRWDRATDTVLDLSAAPGLPPLQDEQTRSFGEDTYGNVWIGLNGGVVRYSGNAFAFFTPSDGLPPGAIVDICTDTRGRLWLASSGGGLVSVDKPHSPRPVFAIHTTADGLSGNRIEAIVSDLHGRIYAATGQGIDQLDPETGRIRHFSPEDGLAPGSVLAAFRDRTGVLWFATEGGLSRFRPTRSELSAPPPPIMITGITVAGRSWPISAIGETDVKLPDLRTGSTLLQIDYVSLRFAAGERLLYEHRLEGLDRDWVTPAPGRSTSYASLAPGRYRFLVRAVNADGAVSPWPAVVAFTVARPFWQRSWFVLLVLIAAGAAAVLVRRRRK